MAQQSAQQRQAQRQTRSRLSLATAAIRPGMHGRMMLSGPSGAGKTYTSLLVAQTLVGPNGRILLIDTEKDSAKTYADEFAFFHLPFQAPYDAVDLAMTLREAGSQYDAIVIDSFTHFWRGQGGILDTASGRWTGWKEARPMHADVIDAILTVDAHVIVCCRSKQEHIQVEENGRTVVRKLGMKAQQDDDLEYEVNVAVEIDMAHVIHVSKSRTRAVPVGTEFIAGHAERFAGVYRDWLAGGEPVAARADTDKLKEALNTIVDAANRQRAKDAFLDMFGRPEFLLESRLPEAAEWVADRLLGIDEPADRAPDAVPAGEVAPERTTHEQGEERPVDPQPTPAEARVPAERCCRPGCGHDRRECHAALASTDDGLGACHGLIATGELEESNGEPIYVKCKCACFITADEAAATGAHVTAADRPAPAPAEPAATSETATQGGSYDPSDATIRAQIVADVEQMSLAQVQSALTTAERSPNGTLKKLRERLVDHRMKAATVPI